MISSVERDKLWIRSGYREAILHTACVDSRNFYALQAHHSASCSGSWYSVDWYSVLFQHLIFHLCLPSTCGTLSSWWKETWAYDTLNLTCHCTGNDIGKTINLFDPHCLNIALKLSVCSVVVATDITDVRRGVLPLRHCAITRLYSDGSSVTDWKTDINTDGID